MNLIYLLLISFIEAIRGQLNVTSECNCDFLHERRSKGKFLNGVKVDKRDLQFSSFLFVHQGSNEFQKNKYYCGAVLVNSEWALSTASCSKSIESHKGPQYIARLGLGGRLDFDSICGRASLFRDIAKFEEHPSFRYIQYAPNKSEAVHDIAMVKLAKKFELGMVDNIFAACIYTLDHTKLQSSEFIIPEYVFRKGPPGSDPKSGKLDLYMTKMRMTDEMCKGVNSTELQKTTLCISDNTSCSDNFGGPALIVSRISTRPVIDKLVLIGIIRPSNFYPPTNETKNCRGKVTLVELLFNHFEWMNKFLKNEICEPDFAVDPNAPRTLIPRTTAALNPRNVEMQESFPWIIVIILTAVLLVLGAVGLYTVDAKRKKTRKAQLEKSSKLDTQPSATASVLVAEKAKKDKAAKEKLDKSAKSKSEKLKSDKSKSEKDKKGKKGPANLGSLSKAGNVSVISRTGSNVSNTSDLSLVSNPNAPYLPNTPKNPQLKSPNKEKSLVQKSSLSKFKPRHQLDKTY